MQNIQTYIIPKVKTRSLQDGNLYDMLQYNDNTVIVQKAKKMLLPIYTFTQAYLLIF